jgi:hypothetical protein
MAMSRVARARFVAPLALLAVGAVAACGSATPSATLAPLVAPPLSPSAASAASSVGPSPSAFAMCDLLTSGEVTSAAPFTIPLVGAKAFSGDPQGCTHSFQGNGDYASVALAVTDFDSPELARAALASHDQVATQNLGIAPQAVSGFGDAATLVMGGDQVSFEVLTGSRLVDASLGDQTPPVTPAQKSDAAESLARMILGRIR